MNAEITLLDKAKAAIAALFTDADKEAIKNFKTELAEAVTPPAATPENEPVKVKTKEGVEFVVEGGLKEGSKVTMVNPENGEVVPVIDGEYELEDGQKVYVTGGLITKVEPKEEAPAVESNPAPSNEAEMTQKMAEQKQEFETKLSEAVKGFEAKLEENNKVIDLLKKQQAFLLGKFEEIANAPVITEEVTPAIPYEQMTPYQKYKYRKQLEGNK